MSFPPSGEAEGANDGPGSRAGPDESVELDLLRADLYRIIDELARAPLVDREELLRDFERAWEQFKDATAGSA